MISDWLFHLLPPKLQLVIIGLMGAFLAFPIVAYLIFYR